MAGVISLFLWQHYGETTQASGEQQRGEQGEQYHCRIIAVIRRASERAKPTAFSISNSNGNGSVNAATQNTQRKYARVRCTCVC